MPVSFREGQPDALRAPGSGGAGPQASHVRTWEKFRAEQGPAPGSVVKISHLRVFASYLLTQPGGGYSSTNAYLDSVVAVESERGSIRNVLFERQLRGLKRAVTRYLKSRQMLPKKACPLHTAGLGHLSSREREIVVVGCALGLRADTLCHISRRQVFLTGIKKAKRFVVQGVQLQVRKDKTTQFRRVELKRSCGYPGINCCPICEVADWATLFPISRAEIVTATKALDSTPHGLRRTCALAARTAMAKMSTKKQEKARKECNFRQGWSDASGTFFDYSEDFERHKDG
ncbi:unnamed protein product, partial [Amoebophrya sp. A120]|eukprot:GSA120T00021929001.1